MEPTDDPSKEDPASGDAGEAGAPPPPPEADADALDALVVRPAAPARAGSGGAALARHDPLRAYMAEVARHPLLSREEEHELAVRYARTGDPDAAWRLVTANLRLVVKIAREYHRTMFQLLDLVQEGNVGLMQAVKKYDPFKGVKLSTYAAWWIRAYIIRFVMDNWRQVKLGTTQAQRKLFFNLAKERHKLVARGIDPTPRLLARNLRVEEQDVLDMTARMGGEEVSLDAPLRGDDGDSGATRLDALPDARDPADETLADDQLRRLFREKLDAFARTVTDERERAILEKRLLPPEGVAPLTLQDIGREFGLTRERARQIEAKLTARLRDYVRAEMPDFKLLVSDE